MHHVIQVSFDGNKVNAVYNPHPAKGKTVYPGDTVTWYIAPADRELQVLFQKFSPFSDLKKTEYCNPLGPFNSVSIGAGLIVGTIRSDDQVMNKRFLYELFENGKALEWKNGIDEDLSYHGGIDIPMTPMTTD